MKKIYTSIKIISLLFIANNLFAQNADFNWVTANANVPMCEGVSLVFFDSSSGATSWDWDFGADAIPSTSTQQNPGLVNFPVCGTYTVTLNINGGGGAMTISETIIIWCNPTACFSVTPIQACFGIPVTFNGGCSSNPSGGALTYLWDFCDGNSSNFGPITTHTYPDTGCYCATLVVTTMHGCMDFSTQQNAVCVSGSPAFTITSGNPTNCVTGMSIDFCTSTVTGGTPPYSFAWNFQGGTVNLPTTVNDACPQNIIYSTAGAWDVTCTVTDFNGCTTTMFQNNYVNIANNSTTIYLTNDTICVGESVIATTPPATTYNWTIAPAAGVTPNTPSSFPSVTYTFSASGTYTITLNAVVSGCAVTGIATVVVYPKPVANFTVAGNLPTCLPPQLVTVTNTTTGGPWTYAWDFGDGFNSNLQNPPPHNYTNCGQYTITLTVTGPSGCDTTKTMTNIVNIDCPAACYSITNLPVEGNYCAPLSLNFDASCSNGTPTQYLWCVQPVGMPPCIPTLNLGPTPSLIFPSEYCYNVTLKTINAQGCTSTITNAFPGGPICVGYHSQPCFTVNPLTTCAPLPVSFTNCTVDSCGIAGGNCWASCHSWCWNFGDGPGCQSTVENPFHLYQDTGCFNIMLVSKNCGCYDTILYADYVCILPPIPLINFSINCDSPNVVIFDGTNSIGADTYIWDFPGGTPSTSTDSVVYVTYPMPNPNASYTAQLKICNAASGCCDSVQVTVFLRNVQIIATVDTVVCYPQASAVTNNSIGAAIYVWKIFDICNNNAQIFSMTSTSCSYDNASTVGSIPWPAPGRYNVFLRIQSLNGGCSDTLEWDVDVRGLIPLFSGAPLTGCAPLLVSYNDLTVANCISNPINYNINYGDNTSSGITPHNLSVNHTYLNNGSYTVSITTTDNFGCQNTDSAVNYINSGLAISETHNNPTCGNSNGSIDLSVNSGGVPYTYLWSNGMTTQDLSGIGNGVFTVTVNDINNCLTIFSVTLANSNALILSETHGNTTCGNTNGNINVAITYGTTPFYYLWNNGATTQDINNLGSGIYTLTVTDFNTCSATINVTINNSNAPQLNEQHIDASCGNLNGTIDLSVSGGTPSYNYQWNNSATTQDLANLSAGNYYVTVTDNNNCTATISVTITITSNPIITEFHNDEMCDSSNGSINISVSNGASPYLYNWSNGATTEDLNNLTSGNYLVTVTDANNCTSILATPIVNHPAPTITVSHVDASCLNCHDGSATVFIGGGGTSPYTIQWNIGSTNNPIINLDPGTYVVCVTDANGCSVCDSVIVGLADGILSVDVNEMIQVIPNPNNGIFTLEFSNSLQIENIEILNLIGKTVFTELFRTTQPDKIQIDFSSAASGIYFLQIKTANEIIRKKILINH